MDFDRIKSTVDIERMQESHVTIIGGAYGLARNLARCALGGITHVDFDTVSASNPARQDFYTTDVGKYKVEAAAEDLQRINPQLHIDYHTVNYCKLSEEDHDALFGHTDLFIFAADQFAAQAKGNQRAVRLCKRALWIGLYQDGRAGEIIYYVPGITPACYRCICIDRYTHATRASVDIPSKGATIFDLQLVDAIAGQLALGILTRGSENRMGRLIKRLGNQNLIQVKIDPDYTLGDRDIFGKYLGDHPANVSFTTIALPMEQEPNCPDCQGHSGPGGLPLGCFC